jgi:hypothetical protein
MHYIKIMRNLINKRLHRHNRHSFQYFPQYSDTSKILLRGRHTKFHTHTENGRIKSLHIFVFWCMRPYWSRPPEVQFEGKGHYIPPKGWIPPAYSNTVSQITEAQHELSPASPSIMIHYEIYRVHSFCFSFYLVDLLHNFEDYFFFKYVQPYLSNSFTERRELFDLKWTVLLTKWHAAVCAEHRPHCCS